MRPLGSLERQRGSIGRVLDLEVGLFAFDGQASQLGRLVRKSDCLGFPDLEPDVVHDDTRVVLHVDLGCYEPMQRD